MKNHLFESHEVEEVFFTPFNPRRCNKVKPVWVELRKYHLLKRWNSKLKQCDCVNIFLSSTGVVFYKVSVWRSVWEKQFNYKQCTHIILISSLQIINYMYTAIFSVVWLKYKKLFTFNQLGQGEVFRRNHLIGWRNQ